MTSDEIRLLSMGRTSGGGLARLEPMRRILRLLAMWVLVLVSLDGCANPAPPGAGPYQREHEEQMLPPQSAPSKLEPPGNAAGVEPDSVASDVPPAHSAPSRQGEDAAAQLEVTTGASEASRPHAAPQSAPGATTLTNAGPSQPTRGAPLLADPSGQDAGGRKQVTSTLRGDNAESSSGPNPIEEDAVAVPTPGASDPVESALKALRTASVVFNIPDKMKGSESEMIELLIDFKQEVEALKTQLEASGRREGASVKVSRKMMAQLTGANFEITPVTPEEQVLLTDEATRWLWEIKPNTSGKLRLHLSLSAIVTLDGETSTRALKTYDREIEVEVAWADRTVSIVENNLEWFWASLVIPAVGFAWQFRRRRHGGPPQEET